MGAGSVSARDIKQSVENSVRLVFGGGGVTLPLRQKQFPPFDCRRVARAGRARHPIADRHRHVTSSNQFPTFPGSAK